MPTLLPDEPVAVIVCQRCGVTETGHPHTYDVCIRNLRDLLRRYYLDVCATKIDVSTHDHVPAVTIDERLFIKSLI